MGLNEKTPLRGSEEHVPYVFMTDPNRAYKKRVRQLQCFLCSAILGIFGLALLVSLAYSVDIEEEAENILNNGSLEAGPLRSQNLLKSGLPSSQPDEEQPLLPTEPKPVYEQADDSLLPSSSPSKLKQLSRCNPENNLDFYCTLSKYRREDGTCNNLDHPFSWGVSNHPMGRLLQPDYCDGISSPKCSTSKGVLPSPHVISSKLTTVMELDGKNDNVMSSLWGQFINQDLVDYSEYHLEELDDSCCKGEMDKDCYPIEISKADPSFYTYNRTCLGYRRTPSVQCSISGQREQLNKATSFLDGSALYGSTSKIENKLRKFINGELVLYRTENNNFLPVSTDIFKCNPGSEGILKDCMNNQGHRCLNEHINLPSINHIMAKQHNFIAAQLKIINPNWSDETLFQEARRIVVAQIQHITYNEFLENIVDTGVKKDFGQINAQTGYYEGYDSNVDPTVSNAFANAAFAMVFNFLPESKFFPEQNKSHPCNHYFISRLIQKGRDHGLPSYLKWREYCGLKIPYTFDELSDVMSPESANALKELYENIEDIDLFAGVFNEKPAEGSAIGPVALCIIRDQFKRLKTGDRFWYETPKLPQAFSREQLAELRKSTLSRIICDHFQETKTIQYSVMKTSLSNPTLLCSAIPSLNLSLWDDSEINQINDHPLNSIQSFNNFQSTLKLEDNNSSFAQSANTFIIKSSSKTTNISKHTTTFTVNIANITASIDGNVIYQEYNKKLPITFPLETVADTSAYTPAAIVSFSGYYEDDILEGTVSVPIKEADYFQRGKKTLTINFTSGVTIKWAGTFAINPKKKYTCNVMFQSYSKLTSPSQTIKKESDSNDENEQCSILLVGTYYHRPFYCAVTPWWCSEGTIFTWSGETKLILTKPTAPNTLNKMTSQSSTIKRSPILGKTDENVKVIKTFASVTVLKGKISGQFNGEDWMDIFNGSPPEVINLNNIVSPNSYDVSTQVTWQATPMEDRFIIGSFSLPYYPTLGTNIERRKFTGNFSLDIIYKYGGSIGIIDPTKTYNCKVLFQGNKKISIANERKISDNNPTLQTIKGKTPFGESCTISVTGTFNQPKIFHWSGDLELAVKYKYNSSVAIEGEEMPGDNHRPNAIDQFVLNVPNSVPLKQLSQKTKTNFVGKTENVVVQKTFASVTVLKGKISGQFNGEEAFEVLNGSPPVSIYLDNVITPNAYDASLTATWKATTLEDRIIIGSFSVPYYPSIEENTDRRKFTANFSVDVIYKYGGSIEIIDPSKTYTCKVMFQENRKSIWNEKLVSIKTKTPFGESCSITISGAFYKPSMFCYLTPWWCSNEKIFYWSGDVELAIKNKFNGSEIDVDENSLKKLYSSKSFTVNSIPSATYEEQDNFCCGHRFGGKVISGWIKANTPGLFSSAQTVWSGELPFEIKMPVFWTPTIEEGAEISTVYGHSVLWSASIFHSTIQGSYSFPQYHTGGALTWITGKYSFQLEPNPYISLYDLILPGLKYNSNLHFHTLNSPDSVPFLNPTKKDPSQEDITYGIRAPIILLGKYTSDQKVFIWNGTFIVNFSKTMKDLTYG